MLNFPLFFPCFPESGEIASVREEEYYCRPQKRWQGKPGLQPPINERACGNQQHKGGSANLVAFHRFLKCLPFPRAQRQAASAGNGVARLHAQHCAHFPCSPYGKIGFCRNPVPSFAAQYANPVFRFRTSGFCPCHAAFSPLLLLNMRILILPVVLWQKRSALTRIRMSTNTLSLRRKKLQR